MKEWQLQIAKQRFSALLRAAENHGPQVITRHGKKVAVMVDYSTYTEAVWSPEEFKHDLLAGPSLDGLDIDRAEDPAPTVEL